MGSLVRWCQNWRQMRLRRVWLDFAAPKNCIKTNKAVPESCDFSAVFLMKMEKAGLSTCFFSSCGDARRTS